MISKEEAERRLKNKHGEKIRFVSYNGMSFKSTFICDCGNIWESETYSIVHNSGCPICALKFLSDKFRKPYNEVKEYIESYGYVLLSKEYVKAREKLDVICPNGHNTQMSWNDFQSGNRCRFCSFKKVGESNLLSEEQYIKQIRDLGLVFDGFVEDYKNSRTKCYCICNNKHRDSKNLGEWRSRTYCSICRKQEVLLTRSGENSNLWQGGKMPIYEYLRRQVTSWKKDSMKKCDFRCIVTRGRFNHIHHLKSFNSIVEEVLIETKLDLRKSVSCYSEEELALLRKTLLDKHSSYPLGVCLRGDVHNRFHAIYGSGNNTPEQWDAFYNYYLQKGFLMGLK